MLSRRRLAVGLSCAAMMLAAGIACAQEKSIPAQGDQAPSFELAAVTGTLDGKVSLKDTLQKGPVVLVVLRGYPGYQCPICSRQVGELAKQAGEFKKLGANVLLVYPGPASNLKKRAQEFVKESELPEPLTLLLDPNYKFTQAYNLRWDAARETAYPSTFVIDSNGKVQYAKISRTHGDRAPLDQVLAAVAKLKR